MFLLFHLYCSFKGGLHIKNIRIIIATIALSLALFSFFALFGSYYCQLFSVIRYNSIYHHAKKKTALLQAVFSTYPNTFSSSSLSWLNQKFIKRFAPSKS
ncbi:hypothetical protein DXB51_17210 [Bacillus cereus]|nr:hypothetical protein DXB51_17210 [Bacillus cereus]